MSDTLNAVLVILALGSAVGPMLFGFTIWKMMAVFVTKQQFEDYKKLAQVEREFMKESQGRIERKVDRILEQTPH